MSQARQHRRSTYKRAGLLSAKNEWGRFSEKGAAWYAMKQDEGRQFQEAHTKRMNDSIEEQLGSKLNSLKATWTASGYDQAEIKMLEEAFTITAIKNKESYREDRKQAIQLSKNANESRNKRLDARDNS